MTLTYQHAYHIVEKLQLAGFIAYFAGGWVRDFVMKHSSEDIDIATNASPDQIIALFPQTLLIGVSFGVVIVVMGKEQFEVATFRKDLAYVNGRHPQGIEQSNPYKDALRRDFTINGLFYDPVSEKIYDYVEGQQAISNKVICAIGNPQERFVEDRLRMLRAFRFASRFGFTIEPATWNAIAVNAHSLFPAVAKERVWQELTKMSQYPRFDEALIAMHQTGLLQEIFPDLKEVSTEEIKQRLTSYKHFPTFCPAVLYLMELFPSSSLNQKLAIAKQLGVTNKDLKLVELMHALTMLYTQEKEKHLTDLHQWAKLLAFPQSLLCMQIIDARLNIDEKDFWRVHFESRLNRLQPHIQRIIQGQPLVTAALLQDYGIKPGIQMGNLLKISEQLAVREDLHEAKVIIAKLQKDHLL